MTDIDWWAHLVWECRTLGVCHMNKTIHKLTVIAIIIELSGRGAGS